MTNPPEARMRRESGMRGADLLVKTLAGEGVTRIFSLSGNQIMPVYDACFEAGIRIIHTRHEAAAVYMAEAWAQLTGETGVAMVTAGAGAGNAAGALFCALASETPLLLLTGDSPVGEDGRGAFQEMDQCAMLAPVCKHSARPARAADLPAAAATALRIAQSGRPGPVHIALGFDVVKEDGGEAAPAEPAPAPALNPGDDDIDAIISAMSAAERPLVICGPVMNRTRFDGHDALSDALGAPVIVMESPRGLRDPALGDIAGLMKCADFVLSLGKKPDFTTGFAAGGAKWISVQPDEAGHGLAARNLGARLARSVMADPRLCAQRLTRTAKAGGRDAWREEAKARLAARQAHEISRAHITSAMLAEAVQREAEKPAHSVMICDGGEFGQWSQALTRGDERIINGVSGAIGGGLCYSLAARLARPDATIFSLMGTAPPVFTSPNSKQPRVRGCPLSW